MSVNRLTGVFALILSYEPDFRGTEALFGQLSDRNFYEKTLRTSCLEPAQRVETLLDTHACMHPLMARRSGGQKIESNCNHQIDG